MAKTETAEARTGLAGKLTFVDGERPTIPPDIKARGKFALFGDIFLGKFGTMILLNILTLLFAAPGAVVIFLYYMNGTIADSMIPYSANLGFGYPVVTDAIARGELLSFVFSLNRALILVPCIMVLALGVAGNLNVMGKLVRGEQAHTVKDFFKGIGKSWFDALIIGLIIALAYVLIVFSYGYFDIYYKSVQMKAVCLTFSIIFAVIVSLFAVFYLVQSVSFKMSAGLRIKNSFLFMMLSHLIGIFFLGLALIPLWFIFIPGAFAFVIMLFVLLGFSFATLVVTVYCNFCFEVFLYDAPTVPARMAAVVKKDGKQPPEKSEKQQTAQPDKKADKRPSEQAQTQPPPAVKQNAEQKKKAPQPYKNPKKGSKRDDKNNKDVSD